MPVIGISVARLHQLLRTEVDSAAVERLLDEVGCDVEGVVLVKRYQSRHSDYMIELTPGESLPLADPLSGASGATPEEVWQFAGEETVVRLDLLPVRPDIFDAGGLARALRGYLGVETGLRQYQAAAATWRVEVDPRLGDPAFRRPFIQCAIVRNLTIDDELLRAIMRLQENLHWALCRDRKFASIGAYDLATLANPIRYTLVDPDSFRFTPLFWGRREPVSPRVMLEQHPKGVGYAHLVAGLERLPALLSANGNVLSLPPIINAEETKLTSATRDVLLDVTGSNAPVVEKALAILATSLLELDPTGLATLERVAMVYPDTTLETPALNVEQFSVDPARAARLLGLPLTRADCVALLEKMRHGVVDALAQGKSHAVAAAAFTPQVGAAVPLPPVGEPGSMAHLVTWRLAPGLPGLSGEARGVVADVLRREAGVRYLLYAYVVMDDHVHAVLLPLGESTLRQVVEGWQAAAADELQRRYGYRRGVWQGEFSDRVLRGEAELRQRTQYILNNPAKRWPELKEYAWLWWWGAESGNSAGADGQLLQVSVAAYRNDIMHEVDLIEDIAIAYGYHRIPHTLVPTFTAGEMLPINRLGRTAATALCGLGFTETVNLVLTSERSHYEKMRRGVADTRVRVANPASADQTMLREQLYAALLETLSRNTDHALPQRIFEVGDVVTYGWPIGTGAPTSPGAPPSLGVDEVGRASAPADIAGPTEAGGAGVVSGAPASLQADLITASDGRAPDEDGGAGAAATGTDTAVGPTAQPRPQELRVIAGALTATRAGYAEGRSVLDALLRELCLVGEYRAAAADENPSALPGRAAVVLPPGGGLPIAEVFEVHPEVLEAWKLGNPVVLFSVVLGSAV